MPKKFYDVLGVTKSLNDSICSPKMSHFQNFWATYRFWSPPPHQAVNYTLSSPLLITVIISLGIYSKNISFICIAISYRFTESQTFEQS